MTDQTGFVASDRAALIPENPTGRSIVSLTTLATIVVVCAILFFGKNLFLPLTLGMLFTFILSPVVNGLRSYGVRDTPAVIMTVCAAAAIMATLVLVMAYQLSQIGANLPKYEGNVLRKIDTILAASADNRVVAHLQNMVEDISSRLETDTSQSAAEQTMKVEVVERSGVKGWLFDVILPALTPVGIFGLIFVVVIFALLERATLRDRLVQLIGGTNILATSRLLAEAGSRVSTYLVAQLLVNVIYAVPICLGLWLIGVPNALFFGLVTLFLRFVPYIGSAISAILPISVAFAVSPDWSMVLWTGGLFLVVELVTSNLIEPYIYGRRTGVSPLALIISAMFWTWLWGPMGLIMATPLTVCLVAIGNHVPSLRLFPIMFGDTPVLAEASRLYDRFLVGRSFEFSEAAAKFAQQRYLAEYYDSSVIPALALAQADYSAGLLSDYQAQRIVSAAWTMTEQLETVVEDELAATEDQTPAEAGASLVENGVRDGVGRRIAVMGLHSQLDAAAAQMIGQALRAEGAEVANLPVRAALPRSLGTFAPDTLVLVSLDPSSTPPTNLLVRQIRRRLPKVTIGLVHYGAASGNGSTPTTGIGEADFVSANMEDLFSNAFVKPTIAAA